MEEKRNKKKRKRAQELHDRTDNCNTDMPLFGNLCIPLVAFVADLVYEENDKIDVCKDHTDNT